MTTVDTRRILVAEADPPLAMVLRDLLEAEFHQTMTASDAATAMQMAGEERFDLILLDVRLPGQNEFEACRRLRQRGIETPILMLSARTTLADCVQALMLGADDFMTKPFHPAELIARVHALLRRARQTARGNAKEHFGEVSLDLRSGRVERNGQPVSLAAKELDLLKYLAERPDCVVTREELLTQVWGYHSSSTRTLDVHVAQLRQKLERNPGVPRLLLTVRGRGYQLCVPQAPNGA